MSNSTQIFTNRHDSLRAAPLGRAVAICKHILNSARTMSERAAERRRFAALPLRQLEDIGMTIAERDAQLR